LCTFNVTDKPSGWNSDEAGIEHREIKIENSAEDKEKKGKRNEWSRGERKRAKSSE
jgi:hypothetical protein